MNTPLLAATCAVAALLISTSGCARQEIMARPGEGHLTAAPVAATPAALVIAPEVRSQCQLRDTEGVAEATPTSLLSSAEVGTLAQLATCFASGPLKGRTMTLSRRAEQGGSREEAQTVGERRANAVQGVLVSAGLPPSSVAMTSRSPDADTADTERRIDIDALR